MHCIKPRAFESGKLASRCKRMQGCKDKLREQRRTKVDFKLESENTGWQMAL